MHGWTIRMAARSDFDIPAGLVGSERLAWKEPHPWHSGERVWTTANSHVDVWVELLHTMDLDPAPVLLSTICADFEGDQWTHTNVSRADLWAAYGIAVDDLCVWRPLLAHLVEQFDRGNAVLVEVDAFHLPALIGTIYQRQHVKTLIAATGYDRHAHRLRYLHGTAGADVGGRDLDALLTAGIGSAQLPPSSWIVKLDRMSPRTPAERAQVGVALARLHGTRIPARNPVRLFGEALRLHGVWLAGGDAEHYERWAFATLHQCGASFELAADVCAWLASHGQPVEPAIPPLRSLALSARALHDRLVRVSQSGKMPDVMHSIDDMARSWDEAMFVLRPLYGV